MQECTPLAVVMIRVQGPGLCDLVYAAAHNKYHGCKAMTLLMQYLQLQLQKVHLYAPLPLWCCSFFVVPKRVVRWDFVNAASVVHHLSLKACLLG